MKIKNTGEKIVGVGGDILMPGEEKSYPNQIANTPGVKVLVSLGYLSMEEDAPKKSTKKTEVVETKVDESEVQNAESAEEKPVKRPRSTKK